MYTTVSNPWQSSFIPPQHFVAQSFMPFQAFPQVQSYSMPPQMSTAAISPWGQHQPFSSAMFLPMGNIQTGFFPPGGSGFSFNPNVGWQSINPPLVSPPYTQVGPSFSMQQPFFSTGGLTTGIRTATGFAQPRVELAETNNDVIVTADLPNVDPNNIYITVTDDSLSISALAYMGGMSSSLHRTVALPTPIRAEHLDVSYTNGILECRLPKSDLVARRRIRVNPTA